MLDLSKHQNFPWLKNRVLFLTRHGSHAYGLNIETSDEDFKGFCVAPREYDLSFHKRFEEAQSKTPDYVIYNIKKFFKLAADCNPAVIEVLWTDQEDHLMTSVWGMRVLEARDRFLSKRVRFSFSGYAMSQLERIETHQRWLKNPPKAPPTRAQFNLPELTDTQQSRIEAAEAMIRKQVDSWQPDLSKFDKSDIVEVKLFLAHSLAEMQVTEDQRRTAAGVLIGLDHNLMALLQQERAYRTAVREWADYCSWKKNRNPARAALEEKFSYDTKHAMHLVRLLRMCREILTTGKVLVKRPDREELLDIRVRGAWPYEKLIEWARTADEECAKLLEASNLPDRTDTNHLDSLCMEIIHEVNYELEWP